MLRRHSLPLAAIKLDRSEVVQPGNICHTDTKSCHENEDTTSDMRSDLAIHNSLIPA